MPSDELNMIQELISKSASEYTSALELKDKARKSKEDSDVFASAAYAFERASDIYKQLIELETCPKTQRIECKIYNQYYLYEKEDCLSAYYYHRREPNEALRHHDLSKGYLENTITMIKDHIEQLAGPNKSRFIEQLNLYNYFLHNKKAKRNAIEARKAWDSAEYIKALDLYRLQANEFKNILDSFPENTPPEYLRIAHGNYLGAVTNIATSLAMISLGHKDVIDVEKKKLLPTDIVNRLLLYTLEAYRTGKMAYHANPEWEQYRKGTEVCKTNIQSFLRDNPNSWKRLLIEFENDHDFVKIMKETDIMRYKETVMSLSPIDNKPIRLWSIGSFFILLVGILSYMLNPLQIEPRFRRKPNPHSEVCRTPILISCRTTLLSVSE